MLMHENKHDQVCIDDNLYKKIMREYWRKSSWLKPVDQISGEKHRRFTKSLSWTLERIQT